LKLQETRLRKEAKNPSIHLSMIFLVQHGKAYTEAEDPERRLTPEGIAETEKVARHLAAAGVRPAEIIHSGKTRARQTAEILARHLGVPVREGEGLGPNDDPTPWARRLSEADNLMVVGHLPHLSLLAALLLTGDPPKEVVKFRYSGVLALTKEQGRWSVAWYITPDLLPQP
jgi:phosphohistidine phosphatase